MSNANYRYYNSEAGVGVVPHNREEGEYTFIKTKDKKFSRWVKTSDLYLTAAEAKGKPFAVFYNKNPQVMSDLTPDM